MSRSKWPKCSRGRGCGVCGDHGESRRRRDENGARVDRDFASEVLADIGRDPWAIAYWCGEDCYDWTDDDEPDRPAYVSSPGILTASLREVAR